MNDEQFEKILSVSSNIKNYIRWVAVMLFWLYLGHTGCDDDIRNLIHSDCRRAAFAHQYPGFAIVDEVCYGVSSERAERLETKTATTSNKP